MCRCADVNEFTDKSEFDLSIMENLELGSTSDKCKVKSLCGRWTKKEKNIEKSTSDKEEIDNTIFIERDKILICNAVVVDDTFVPGFYRALSVHKKINKWWMFDKKIP